MTATTTACEISHTYPAGPHPGCAEFDGGATIEVQCTTTATRTLVLSDPATAWEGSPDGVDTLRVCDAHHAEILHDIATGAALTTTVLSDTPIALPIQTSDSRSDQPYLWVRHAAQDRAEQAAANLARLRPERIFFVHPVFAGTDYPYAVLSVYGS